MSERSAERSDATNWFQDIWSFDGRIGRAQWWAGYLLLLAWIGGGLGLAALTSGTSLGLLILLLVFPLAAYWGFASNAKRWHDRGKSGWWSLIWYIPLIGPLWLFVELGFLKGTNGPNKYGPPPGTSTTVPIAASGSRDSHKRDISGRDDPIPQTSRPKPVPKPSTPRVHYEFSMRPFGTCRTCGKAWDGQSAAAKATQHSTDYDHQVVLKGPSKSL